MCAHHLPSIGECGSPSLIGILVMNAVRGHPENRSAFERQRRANRQQILHPLRSLVAAMRQQPVIAHPDAQAARNPPQKQRDKKCLPGEKEQRGDRAQMKASMNAAVTQLTSLSAADLRSRASNSMTLTVPLTQMKTRS